MSFESINELLVSYAPPSPDHCLYYYTDELRKGKFTTSRSKVSTEKPRVVHKVIYALIIILVIIKFVSEEILILINVKAYLLVHCGTTR
jgi:hypothetical protein